MKMLSRLVAALPLLALLLSAAPPLHAQSPPGAAPSLPAGITPQELEAAKKAIQSGAPLPPEVQRVLEAYPELKDQIPPEPRKRIEVKETAKDAATKPAGPPEGPTIGAAYDWRKSSYVAGLFAERLNDAEIGKLEHLGHALFAPRPGGVSILENIPVSADYVVGPGDEVIVRLWGRLEGTYRMEVDREGKIFVPKIGSLYVAGKTFSELKSFLKAKVSAIAQVSSDVSLGQMKGIRVSVAGEVPAPGWYSVSSLHTVVQLLALSGGVKDIGSFRRIALRRGGKAVETIDLYDYLLRGDTRDDIRLLQGDTIFVPVVGSLVALTGEVRRPAIYELREEKTLLDLVTMAGGFAPTAFKRRVQVERLERNLAKIVLDADAEELEKGGEAFALSDGDIVRVLPILLADNNAATLEGNVLRPGKYEIKPGTSVGILLGSPDDFLPETYFDYATLTRLVPPDMHEEIIPLSLREIVLEKKPEADVVLQGRDTLRVYPKSAFRDRRRASISGEVRMAGAETPTATKAGQKPTAETMDRREPAAGMMASRETIVGTKAGQKLTASADPRSDNTALTFDIPAGARVADLVKLAGGLTRLAALDRAEIVRVDENRTFRTIYFNLGKAMAGDDAENPVLEDEDRVRIHSVWETRYMKTVTAAGEVNSPGDFILTDGMKLSDLVFKAGGFREGAYKREAELIRRKVADDGSLVRTETVVVFPERIAGGEQGADLSLKEYDLLVIRTIPDWAEKIRIAVSGEVRFPGFYEARKGERLSSLVARAGGFTPDAYLKGAVFTRVSTQKTQQEAIDRMIEDLELTVAQKSQESGAALDKEDVESNKQLLEARRSLLAQLRKVTAKGRVIIRLADAEKLKGTSADIDLEDGDRLEVPRKMNVVNVVGRVYNPTGVTYDPANATVGHYLNTVGGPTESADSDHIFMIKADGSVVTKNNTGGGFFAFGSSGLMSAKAEPGDSIVVPEKIVQVRAMKDFKDITQILYQIAVTAGVLIVVF